MAKFLNKGITNDEIEKLKDHLNLENMKNSEAVTFKEWFGENVSSQMPFPKDAVYDFLNRRNSMRSDLYSDFIQWIEENSPNSFLF